MHISIKEIARILGGEVRGTQCLCPGPGHSRADRSLSVTISASGDDIVVHSFASDDPIACKDYVREKCGIPFKPNGRPHFSDADIERAVTMAAESRAPKSKPTATYDYQCSDGTPLYQVARYDNPKRFQHRQPDGHGGWVYRGTQRRVLYRYPDLLKFPSATIFVTEGEKDCDRLWSIDLCATTVASGKWTDHCVQALAGRHVLILEDNDEAGRKKALEAAKLLYDVADTVRVVRLPGLLEGEDVSDWLDADPRRGASELAEICFDAPLWEPGLEQQPEQKSEPIAEPEPTEPIPTSKSLVAYPLIAFADVSFDNEIAYLVQGLLPRSGLALVWGPKKCGKSFWIMDLALHVALGWSYRGRRVEQVPVVYLALEGQAGYGRRIEAFKQHHNVREAPFYLLRTAVNLVTKADEIIKNIAQQLASVGLIVVDTMNRSLPGSESSDEDMSKYLNAAAKFVKQFDCIVALIHHPGHDESRPRGHSALGAAVDAQIAVRRGAADLEMICELELAKDDAAGTIIYSRLQTCEIGFDANGDPIGSMVVVPSEQSPANASVHLSGVNKLAYDSLINAVAEAGEKPPASDHIPQNSLVVTEKIWTELFVRTTPGNYSDPDNARRVLVQAATKLKNMNLIGLWRGYAWPCR